MMKKIGSDWKYVKRGSLILYDKPHKFRGLDKTMEKVKGKYYITGFWGDAMGLNRTDPNGENEIVAPSASLQKAILIKGKLERVI
jgi:hypothetical protein